MWSEKSNWIPLSHCQYVCIFSLWYFTVFQWFYLTKMGNILISLTQNMSKASWHFVRRWRINNLEGHLPHMYSLYYHRCSITYMAFIHRYIFKLITMCIISSQHTKIIMIFVFLQKFFCLQKNILPVIKDLYFALPCMLHWGDFL